MLVTVAQLIEASEKNGYPWSHDAHDGLPKVQAWINSVTKETHVSSTFFLPNDFLSCVVGQGVINLQGNHFPNDAIFGRIYVYNDIEATSYEDALRYMKEVLKDYLEDVIEI